MLLWHETSTSCAEWQAQLTTYLIKIQNSPGAVGIEMSAQKNERDLIVSSYAIQKLQISVEGEMEY